MTEFEPGYEIGPYPHPGGLCRTARRRADTSQREMAELVGVSRSTIARIEAGTLTPSLDVLGHLVDAGGLTLVAVDGDGRLVVPMMDLPGEQRVRDGGGKRFPAHLDTILDPQGSEWWGSCYGLAKPPESAHRDRELRDIRRARSQWDVRVEQYRTVPPPPTVEYWLRRRAVMSSARAARWPEQQVRSATVSTEYRRDGASGTGLATITAEGTVLDVWYPEPALGDAARDVASTLEPLVATDEVRGTRTEVVRTTIASLADAPVDAADVYLRLHLLSHRLVRPHEVSLEGQFGLLTNVVWTDHGPCAVPGFELTRAKLRAAHGSVTVTHVDKFPRMVDYVIPSSVRIGDADRVRLGAHLAEGTTVMHEGFVNFNAGTLGSSMVEGRISAGVVVGDGSDVGGGGSIMGTLSGGGKEVISIGRRCLLGANAGLGISLGDDCVVEAGLYVTAGTKVTLPDGTVVAARTLSGQDGVLLRRNSATGAVEAQPRTGDGIALNAALHTN